jgi:RHS repeat-associated protein
VLTHTWLYQDQLRIAGEIKADGSLQQFVYGEKINVPSLILRRENKVVVAYRVISDHLGSVRLVVNASDGTIMQRMRYDEYGQVLEDTNPGSQPFGYAGGLYDSATGLVRFGARDYDPEIGRWLAKDPIGFEGKQLNLYAYVGGNPINAIDPFGLAECDVVIAEALMKEYFPNQSEMKYPSLKNTRFANLNRGNTSRYITHGVTNKVTGMVTFDSQYQGSLSPSVAFNFLDTYVHEAYHLAEPVTAGAFGGERYERWHDYVHQRGADFAGLLSDEYQRRRAAAKCGCGQ